ncbi:hypothetical protein [Novacetimonas pomaceti]|uniref:hypothetical protein n=1 Tax=Novacetimonas pomaceti TaxID=2021998 RepID=UPI001C2DC955|nr:hypothetical protein [Novacetimonas pomaceti]MBV1834716.1 hypothetical protein [Novacetimonas pomaceti]
MAHDSSDENITFPTRYDIPPDALPAVIHYFSWTLIYLMSGGRIPMRYQKGDGGIAYRIITLNFGGATLLAPPFFHFCDISGRLCPDGMAIEKPAMRQLMAGHRIAYRQAPWGALPPGDTE